MPVETKIREAMVEHRHSEIESLDRGPVLDAACLAELRALDPDGRGQLVKRVLATYQTSLVRLVDQLRQARVEAAWEQVSRVAHTLKSSSASIGALALAGLCADIERLLRAGDREGAGPLLDHFGIEVGRVEIAVRNELAACEAAGP
jgi:HPt (histidine-containing phosphotransfer) domain-containing protein